MVNEYKRIVLLTGLQWISDYNFRIVKSLLIHDLQLTKKMQDEYDRIKIADLMEEKFQKDAGLSILIELYQDIPELGDLVDTLRKEMAEVENKSRSKAKSTAIGPSQNESSTSHFVFNTEEDLELGSTMATPSSEKPEDALTKSLNIVTTQSFQEEFKLPELSTANRCPAMSEPQTSQGLPTTACSSLQTPLEPPEILHSILTTSQGPSAPFSTSDQTSQVSPVTASSSIHTSQVTPATVHSSDQTSRVTPTTVPSSVQAFLVTPATTTSGYNSPLVSAARVSGSYNTPQFTPTARASNFNPPPQSPASRPSNFSMQQASLATVSRSFSAALVSPATPFKKKVKGEFIYYGIEDNTGKMEVVVHGQFTNMYCEPGDKLRLLCFELSSCVDTWQLSSCVDTWQLRSEMHSYLQVIWARRRDIEPPNPHSAMEIYQYSNINTTEQHRQ